MTSSGPSTGVRTEQAPSTNQIGVMLASVLTTVSSVYPAFLAGALGPELRSALDLSEQFFGFVVGGFFMASALGSVSLGRLGERLGARRMIALSLMATASATAAIAAFVRSGPALIAVLAVAGLANSASQTSANKLLGQGVDPRRLGFAMAVKQAGMPGATLLGGLAVPLIALTIGWQWGYAAASLLALISLVVVLRFAPSHQAAGFARPVSHGVLTSPRSTLVLAAAGAGFASAGAGTLGNWTTSSAADAGWSTGAAGLLLSLGALSGITSRLVLGWLADRSDRLPMRTAAHALGFGALGALLLAPRLQWTHVIAIVVAFAAGWGWPALYNFAVVRTNSAAAAAATGITQTGVYIGVFVGPITMGFMVERWGYGVGWSVIAGSMAIGSGVMLVLAPRFGTR